MPFLKEVTVQGEDLSPRDNAISTAPATTSTGSPGKWEEATPVRVEMLHVGKSAWLRPLRGREKAQHTLPGHGARRLCTNRPSVPRTRQTAFAAGTLSEAFEELLGPFVPPWRRLPARMCHCTKGTLPTVVAVGSDAP